MVASSDSSVISDLSTNGKELLRYSGIIVDCYWFFKK